MTSLTVLIGEDVGEANLARMRATFPNVNFQLCRDEAAFHAVAPQADIIFSKRFFPRALDAATRLQWIQAGTAGVNHLLAMGLDKRDVLLTNASGAHGIPMAELILSMMLAFATGLHTLMRGQSRRGRVGKQVIRDKFELEGQTLCVLGLGDIGGTLARKAKKLGMKVFGVRRSHQPFAGIDGQVTPDRLMELLPQSDHVALCLPLTQETAGIIGATELRAMQSSAYIYIVGRGNSIEPNALLQALAEGWFAGAGLDVTDPEPLPDDSPLWEMPNVILSQHTSGSSPFNADRITTIFLDNLERFCNGTPLQNMIDKKMGY
jgi:phosphoglycerate dehydrogenase-like enzyme